MSAANQHSARTNQPSMPNGFVPRAKAWAKEPPRLAIHAGMPYWISRNSTTPMTRPTGHGALARSARTLLRLDRTA